MKSRFPDLTFFFDAAGRYSHSKQTPIVICAVSIETNSVDEVRESLLNVTKGSSVKWSRSDGNHDGARAIFRLLVKRQLFWLVRIIWKDTPEWERYFATGNELYKTGVQKAQEAMPYAKPMNTFKLHQFGLASAELLGFYLKQHSYRLPRKDMPIQPITITGVLDSDIQGQANQETCQKVFEGLGGDLPQTVQATRIQAFFKVSIQNEQEEPLLLLPDHIAGYFYSRIAYGLAGENVRESLLSAVEPIYKQVPNSCHMIVEEKFREEYLLPSTTFDHVLPKREREALLKALCGEKKTSSEGNPTGIGLEQDHR